MKSFRTALTALVLSACVPAYAGTRVVVQRGGYTGPLEIRVGIPQEGSEPKWLEAKRLAAESTVEIAPLAAGTYVVLLSGDAAFERFATRVGVRGEGDEVLRIVMPQPQRLRGAIRIGLMPAGDAVLNFEHTELGWSTTFSARSDGTFDTPLWQTGDYVLIARGGALASPARRPVRIEGPTVSIDLSPLSIRGIVSDAGGAPIPEARVALRTEFGRDKMTVRVYADAHGMFEFADLKAGPYSITVVAEGYLIATDHRVYLTGETPVERVGVTMNSGLRRSLRIVDAAGKPVANAVVNVSSDAQLRFTTTSDVEGRATVSIPPAGSAAVWVIPPAGSFAVFRLEADQTAPEMGELVVPDGSASVTIDVLAPDQSGVPGLGLLMRYNGEILLPNTFGLRTDEKGRARLSQVPPGFYEFWPFMSAEEAAELIASQAFSPGTAPITVEAAEGESRATVIVEKNESKRGVASDME